MTQIYRWQKAGMINKYLQVRNGFQIYIYIYIIYTHTHTHTHTYILTSLVAQTIKHLPAMRETRVQFLGWEDLLEKEMATHSSILAWRIPRTEEPGRLQSMGSQRVGHDWATSLTHSLTHTYICTYTCIHGYMYICTDICMYVCVCIYIYISRLYWCWIKQEV